mmetsp:Transcript_17775/g.60659  ORF Transcript_17775/g.60659 Transcript_17775/m.60659 type:complete len:216 (+) Transcript_17775:1376-2023(+)
MSAPQWCSMVDCGASPDSRYGSAAAVRSLGTCLWDATASTASTAKNDAAGPETPSLGSAAAAAASHAQPSRAGSAAHRATRACLGGHAPDSFALESHSHLVPLICATPSVRLNAGVSWNGSAAERSASALYTWHLKRRTSHSRQSSAGGRRNTPDSSLRHPSTLSSSFLFSSLVSPSLSTPAEAGAKSVPWNGRSLGSWLQSSPSALAASALSSS